MTIILLFYCLSHALCVLALHSFAMQVQQNIKVKRDPKRLYSATEASKRRAEDQTPTGGQLIVRAPPRLAIPNWRKGL